MIGDGLTSVPCTIIYGFEHSIRYASEAREGAQVKELEVVNITASGREGQGVKLAG